MLRLLGIFISYFVINTGIFAASAVDELVAILNQMQTMQADFEQTGKIVGSMAIVRPGKFYWHITSPSKQLIIINNQQLAIYDMDLEQVTKRKMDYHKPGNPAMLLSGDVKTLKHTFSVNKLNKSVSSQDAWFELTPKKGDYQTVQMHFLNNKLVAMEIMDNLGQKSAIKFANVVLNNKINANKFILKTLPNTDVINEA